MSKKTDLFKNWDEAYSHIAYLLKEFYIKNKGNNNNVAKAIFNKLKKSKFLEINSKRFLHKKIDLKEKGLDPIQIFASFNYSGIKNKRIDAINLLFNEFNSKRFVDNNTSFEGCPTTIITKIINYRGWEAQNQIWDMFHDIYSKGVGGLTNKYFLAIKKWRGIDIASFTMFLFWVNSEQFLPLDKNTVKFLKSWDIIFDRPRTYNEYYNLCTLKINISSDRDKQKNIFKNIVKDAYNITQKDFQGDILSGSTMSVITNEITDIKSLKKLQKEAKLKQKEQFKNFKIIAIRPKVKKNRSNENDKQKHLKNLKEGKLYQFYHAYNFNKDNDKKIQYIEDEDVSIYNQKQIDIAISAVVGMNGSGKSTIAEFIYLIINKIAFYKKIKSTEELYNEEIFADIFVMSDKLYKISVGNSISLFEYKFEEETSTYNLLTTKKESRKAFNSFNIENFCYSVIINYSLYGINSNIIGDWINPLFHKNDSYQVPIVLNPKRDNGNIDVNNEDELAKSRMLSNILDPDLNEIENKEPQEIVPNAVPEKLLLEFDYEKLKRKKTRFREFHKKNITKRHINSVIKFININEKQKNEYVNETKEYIYLKIVSIAHTYPKYKIYKNLPKWIVDEQKLNEYINKLLLETSHITFKLNQAINYLKYGIYEKGYSDILEISNNIRKIKLQAEMRTIDLVPPSFFKTNIIFNHGGNFNDMSSGEKQQVFSINTIGYHLYNIDSVMEYYDSFKYSSVNLIFDEVELYFHPDMQRTYISNLIKRISTLNLNYINNINMLFITHSPFILSDIPSQNILRLEEGNPKPIDENEKTFGANIHDLLANDFFLQNGFMGEYAKQKINKVIDTLRIKILIKKEEALKSKKLSNEDKLKLIKKQPDYKELESLELLEQKDCEKIISIVGEPLLYMSLMELYSEAFKGNKEEFINEQIEKLNKLKL